MNARMLIVASMAAGCWGGSSDGELLERLTALEEDKAALQERVTELEVEQHGQPHERADELDAFVTHQEVREYVDRRMRVERVARRGLLKAEELDSILEDFVDRADLEAELTDVVREDMLAEVLTPYVDRAALTAELERCVQGKDMPTWLQGYATEAWAHKEFARAFDRPLAAEDARERYTKR